MFKHLMHRLVSALLFTALLLLLFGLSANASEYYWMKGDRKITLRLYPGLVADVPNDKWEMQLADFKNIKATKLTTPSMIIYSLKDVSLIDTEDFLYKASPGISPVFKQRGGGYQTLPGGYLIVFEEYMNQASIDAFFRAENILLNQISAMSWSAKAYKVSDIPGLISLNMANRLAIMPGVKSAYPDIWSTGYSVQ